MKLKTTLKRLLPLLPPYVQRFLRARAALRREQQTAARKERTQVEIADVLARLANLRLSGDLMVHGSISNIGKFDKPVGVLVSAWIEQLDLQNQTLLVPALPYNTTMREYLEGKPNFDVRSAKNAMGAISNIVMAIPEARRSIHPTHSVVALGANADFYVNGHELDRTPFGPNSPYRKLTERHGKILMFGVGLNSVTCFHVYEDMLEEFMPLSVYLGQSFDVSCIGRSGNTLSVTTTCHNPSFSAIRECERARSALIDAGAIVSYPLGESELSIIDAKRFTVTLLNMLASGKSIYGPVVVNAAQKKRIHECLERLS
ncbi:AAC(3) family N-acetyltransferase [Rhodoferax sp.]|uniref:AAC(3) family N-acetyltransferase n=1 Tax=Rhodoferax sp. TaxID=50421 RepID=UPI001EC2538B|nr:AAC(3) family N-acetyltransferase [Rhodoferax sp.]MBT9507780.1 AAC(3) family N-acetyltransferase [Rhodoferax sp.]